MCGIICIVSKSNVFDLLIDSLKQLQNRGYDSSGVGIINNKIEVLKYATTNSVDSIQKIIDNKSLIQDGNIGIAHTRWATHGGKTDLNSHPHMSNNCKISVVHNGIIENYQEIKNMLIKKGYIFYSETDTEVIANLLEYNYKVNSFSQAIDKTIQSLSGTYGLGILNLDEPNRLYCVRKGSPLLIGRNDNLVMVTSEKSGFNGNVNNYFILNKNDICIIENNNKISINTNYKYGIKDISNELFSKTCDPYPHWTIKEINEQIVSSYRVINLGGRLLNEDKVKLGGLENHRGKLKKIDNLVLLGCGTSLNACEYAIIFFKELCNFNIIMSFDGGEFSINDIPKIGNTALVLLSQSGETQDLYRCLKIGRKHNLFIISIVNVIDSLIAREADCGCYLNAGREVGVASTKSFTNQCILLSMVAIWFSQIHNINDNKRIRMIRDLRNLGLDIKKTIDIGEFNKDLYLKILNKNQMFILGKGQSHPIAKEGALKIKEISYIFTEGYSSSSLKHGTFALLDENVPIIIISPNNEFYMKNRNSYEEVKARNSPIIVITDKINNDFENKIIIPENKTYSNLLAVIPLQFMAYYLSVNRNINPDRPRNLAKCVTVE